MQVSCVDGRAHGLHKGRFCTACRALAFPVSLAEGVCCHPWGCCGVGSAEHRAWLQHQEEPKAVNRCPQLSLVCGCSPRTAAQPCRELDNFLFGGIFLALGLAAACPVHLGHVQLCSHCSLLCLSPC